MKKNGYWGALDLGPEFGDMKIEKSFPIPQLPQDAEQINWFDWDGIPVVRIKYPNGRTEDWYLQPDGWHQTRNRVSGDAILASQAKFQELCKYPRKLGSS